MAKTKDLQKIDEIIKRHKAKQEGLVGILQDVQSQFSYLPKEALSHIAKTLDVPLSQTYSLATFYRAFTLKPRGKYLISVCIKM